MTTNTSVVRDDRLSDFVSDQVKDGRYASPSEVVRAGLRLPEARAAKIEALREAIQEGVDSGPATDFDFDEFMRELDAERGLKSPADASGAAGPSGYLSLHSA